MSILLLSVAFLLPGTVSASYYFNETFDNFTTVSNRWYVNFPYGRNGSLFVTNKYNETHNVLGSAGHTKAFLLNNQLCFTGAVQSYYEYALNEMDWYTAFWVGNTLKLTNTGTTNSFTATPSRPFGFEVMRTWARLDANNEAYCGTFYLENESCQNEMSIWLVSDDGSVSGKQLFQSYDNAISMFERYQSTQNTNNLIGGYRSMWGLFNGSETRFDLRNARFKSGTQNLVDNQNYGLEWCYDDDYGRQSACVAGTLNSASSNTNVVGLKMTHDGSMIRFYMNPNPKSRPGNPFPNEYTCVGSNAVTWNTKLRPMMGVASHVHYTEKDDARFDDFLVRSVANTLTAEIYPADVVTNSTLEYTLFIKPTFTSNDSGIGELRIVRPDGFSSYANIKVYTEWGDSANDNTLALLNNVSANPANPNEVWVVTNGNTLSLRFCQISDATKSVIRKSTLNNQIEVKFTVKNPSVPDPIGKSFQIFANCVKYDGNTYSTNSTTADIRANSGNATATSYGDVGITPSYNRMAIKIYANQSGLASITPSQMYQDTKGFTFNYLVGTSTTNKGPDISDLLITIPPGFTVSNISSVKIFNPTYIRITNITGTNRIHIDYDGAGTVLPAKSGIDFITFQVTSTPTNGFYKWPVLLTSQVGGTSAVFAETNDTFQSQSVRVIAPPPTCTAYETATGNLVSSALTTNRYNYFLVNTAERSINKIRRAKIVLPQVFNRITNVSSLIVPVTSITVSNATTIIVDYSLTGTNISPFNQYDRISFVARDAVLPTKVTNVQILSFVDNFNSEGYIPTSEGSIDYQISFAIPDALANASIRTNQVHAVLTTNQFNYRLFNNGSTSNEIYKARILIPSVFSNIKGAVSSKASLVKVTNSSILLDYLPAKLKPGELDTITFKMRTATLTETNVEIQAQVCNTTDTNYFRNSGILGGGSKNIDIVYPDPSATAFVEINSNSTPPLYIDSSTVTNDMVCTIRNTGETGNVIRTVTIALPKAIFTNALYTNNGSFNCAKSLLLPAFDANVRFYDPPTGDVRYFLVNYAAGGVSFNPGMQDVVRFKVIDKISGNTNFSVVVNASNVKSTLSTTTEIFKTKDITIKIPPTDAVGGIQPVLQYTGTSLSNQFTYTVKNKGRGSNRLTRVVISNSSGIAGWNISSAVNTWFTNPSFVTVQPNKVIIDYQGVGRLLGPQATDTLTLTLQGSLSVLTNINFEMRADNNDGNGLVATGIVSNSSKTVKSTVQPTFAMAPRQLFTTASASALQMNVWNGLVKGQKLYKLRIMVPTPGFITNGLGFSSTVWAGATTSRSGTALTVDYSLNPLDAGQSDIIAMNIQDAVINPTNIDWNLEVDYNDGFGWRSARPAAVLTNRISFLLPAATAKFDVTPNSISKDVMESSFALRITNSGVVGNKILMARVQVPAILTNLSAVTSSIIGTSAKFSNQSIYVRYHLSSTNLSPGAVDTLRFSGFDNIATSTQLSWSVDVANSTLVTSYTSAAVNGFGRNLLNVILPAYDAKMFVTPNQVNTVSVTNLYLFTLQNSSSNVGNNIQTYEIMLPAEIITNQMRISNTKPSTILKLSDRIRITYVGGLAVGLSDTIKVYARDNWVEGTTTSVWSSFAQFSTSGSTFIPVRTPGVSGQTNSLRFQMPAPELTVSMTPVEVYTTSKTNLVRVVLKNSGKPGNTIYQTVIKLPSAFTNGFTTGSVTGTLASGISYAAGLLDLDYMGLVSGSTDVVLMKMVNSRTSVASVAFSYVASNILSKAQGTGVTNISIVVPPSCFVIPNQVETTSFSNRFDYFIRNDGTGNSAVKKAVIQLPSALTNFRYYASLKASNYLRTTTSITLVYPGAGLPKGEQDVVQLMCFDNMNFGSNSFNWQVCSVDNSFGKAPARLNPGQSLLLTFAMPPPDVKFHVTKGTNNLLFVNDDTNTFQVILSNSGTGGNHVYKAVVTLPTSFTNFDLLSSSKLGSTLNLLKGISSFTMNYEADANGVLRVGQKDIVTVRGYDAVTKNTNVFLSCVVDNYDGKGFYVAPKPTGKLNSLKFSFPPNAIAAYIENEISSIYTFNTNMRQNYNGVPLTFKVENLSFTNQIDYIRIPFKFPQYRTNIVVRSTLAPTAGITNTGTEIIVDYTVAGTVISNNKSDTISFDLYYCLSNVSAVTMACKVRFAGFSTNIDTVVPAGRQNILSILKPTWGKAAGQVFPASLVTTIRLFQMGSSTIALDRLGRPASYSFDSTKPFLLDNIVPGMYRFEYSSDGYLTGFYGVTNIEIRTNNIRYSNNRVLYYTLPDTRLKANSLKSRLEDDQVRIFTAKDGGSAKFIAPTGSLASDFYLEIYQRPLDSVEMDAVVNNKEMLQPSTMSGMKVYDFDVENLNQADIGFVNLKSEGQIVLPLDNPYLASSGWSSAKLAIAYFDPSTKRWIVIGGKVDTASQTITANANYLYRTYAVVAIETDGDVIQNVKVDNNPFTPLSADEAYRTANIVFLLNESIPEVTVRIYNMKGELIRKIEVDGTYGQCTATWDGRDTDLKPVPAGVYIYQIRANKAKFTGTIMLAK